VLRFSQQTLYFLFVLAALTGCGKDDTTSLASKNSKNIESCQTGTAKILVQDGFMKIICGCEEAPGTVVAQPNSLTCSLSRTTVLFFDYSGTSLPHQIYSSEGAFAPSNPDVKVHPVTMNVSGTFAFSDRYNSNLLGKIVVR
jgi:hypothetical protein